MTSMNWTIQTTKEEVLPMVVSEYLLNEMGVFIKSELRMPKKSILTAVTGFRIGYEPVKGTDYRMAPWNRNAILWHKITSVELKEPGMLLVNGNTQDVIEVVYNIDNSEKVIGFIEEKRRKFPPIVAGDRVAAAWMCWRDDDEWEDRYMSLTDMVAQEGRENRFIEDYILEESVLDESIIQKLSDQPPMLEKTFTKRPKFCSECGATLKVSGNFCENCGTKIKLISI